MTKLKVAVRVRPMSLRYKEEIKRFLDESPDNQFIFSKSSNGYSETWEHVVEKITETEIESVPVISVLNEESLEITNIKVPEQNVGDSRERVKRFTFDYCFHESCSQNYIFEKINKVISQSIKQRNHSCVLAYGQSSTGKTHTMMGVSKDPGLIPNFCHKIFDYLQETAIGEEVFNMKVTVSYFEIYNEKVRDLLNSTNESKKISLKIREHPKKGPYVQGLSEHPVRTASDLISWLEEGNKHRKVAATYSNPLSSRSHSVFVVNCDGVKLNLIDLAGSERATSRCFNISRFKEGSNINRSIVALGNVISALADQTAKQARGIRRRFVPFRDSILTWILKDILGGNSNTVMVATVSPSSACYNETVNTLRFGQRAKNIIFRPVVNEDPKEKTIRELRAEIFMLKELLKNVQLPWINQMYFKKDIAPETQKHVLKKSFSNPRLNSPNCVLTVLTNKLNLVERPICTEDQLIPVIDVGTKIEEKDSTATFIMSSNKTDPEKFGSDDSTISSKSITSNQSSERGSGSQTSRRSSLRTELHKSVSSLSRTSSKRESLKAISSENLSKRPEPKPSLNSKSSPRSKVVAAVTSRLYNKVKKKEVATDTDDINTYNLSVFPKELVIMENARARLRNITRKALRANRIKNQDMQTDLEPVKRMKEISTNTSDLKVDLEELKHVGTMTTTIKNQDACVDCSDLSETATDVEEVKNLLITRSCGTQFRKEDSQKKQIATKPSTLISFTKYLKATKEDVSTEAIYTNVVNINISNNYAQDKPSHSVSCDSLDHLDTQSAYMVTPDLLSNHPALETSSKEVQTWYHGSIEEIEDEFSEKVEYASEDYMKVYNKAKCSSTPNHSVAVPSIKLLKTHVAQTYRSAMQEEEFCLPLKDFEAVTVKPRIVHCDRTEHDDVVLVKEPHVLHHNTETEQGAESLKNVSSVNPKITKNLLHFENGDAQRMVTAMSAFLEEATGIMTKLSGKAEENNNAYDLQITVSGLKTVRSSKKKKKSQRNTEVSAENEKYAKQLDQHSDCNKTCFKCFRERGSQTLLPITYNCSTQSDSLNPLPPINKYEIPFEAACTKLEKTLSLVPNPSGTYDGNTDELLTEVNQLELDKDDADGACFSDYGSLPKEQRRKYRTWSMTPRSYLKQLTAMRRDIVENSRGYLKSCGDQIETNEAPVKYNASKMFSKMNRGDHTKNNT